MVILILLKIKYFFLQKELGGNNTPIIGTDWGYFNDNNSRIAKMAQITGTYQLVRLTLVTATMFAMSMAMARW